MNDRDSEVVLEAGCCLSLRGSECQSEDPLAVVGNDCHAQALVYS